MFAIMIVADTLNLGKKILIYLASDFVLGLLCHMLLFFSQFYSPHDQSYWYSVSNQLNDFAPILLKFVTICMRLFCCMSLRDQVYGILVWRWNSYFTRLLR